MLCHIWCRQIAFLAVFTLYVFSILLGLLMPCHIRCRQMGFLLCFQNTSDFECLVTYSAAKWLSSCVHPVCFVKTPRVLNALSHLVQTNSFPPVFSQCVFSKHLGFECLVTCSAGKWRSSCVHLYSVFFQYSLDYSCLVTLGADKWLSSCTLVGGFMTIILGNDHGCLLNKKVGL